MGKLKATVKGEPRKARARYEMIKTRIVVQVILEIIWEGECGIRNGSERWSGSGRSF